MLTLRPYQQECIDEIEQRGPGRWLCQLATGLGKTVIFANIPRHGRTLILSHRQELVTQPLKYFTCSTAVEMADRAADSSGAEIVSASVQTMSRRMTKYAPDEFHTIIVDEAHHAASETYRKILDYFSPVRKIGFTATPNRADGLGLESAFDEIIFQRDLRWGIEQGFLSRIRCRRCKIGFDLAHVATRMGDYAPGELSRAVNVESSNNAIAQIVKTLAITPVLIFCVDVAHAEAVAAAVNAAGIKAKALSAQSKDRNETVKAFKSGELPVLVNCALFTEGTDLPNTRTVIIARPTKSNALYTQMVGRGTRLAEGKDFCTLIDCVGVSSQPLCTAPSLLGLDIDSVPKRYETEIEGDLLDDIPDVIRKKMDTPESWIQNSKLVDLWAHAKGYQLHDINFQRAADGSLSLHIPRKGEKPAAIRITAPDLMDQVTFSTSGQFIRKMKAQDAYDLTFQVLRTRFLDARPLWSLSSAKRWGAAPANEKQLLYIKRLSRQKHIDVSNVLKDLTKLQASSLIERLK